MLQEPAYNPMTVHINVLPRREYECAHYLLDGYTSKEIAEKLNISSRTVEVYFERLKTRFNSRNKLQLVRHLMENVFLKSI